MAWSWVARVSLAYGVALLFISLGLGVLKWFYPHNETRKLVAHVSRPILISSRLKIL